MTGLYIFISFLISLFWLWPYSLRYVTQYVNKIKLHSVETVSEVRQNSSVKSVTYVKQRTWSKGKVKLKTAGQFLTYSSKNFHWLNKKLYIECTITPLGKPYRKQSQSGIKEIFKQRQCPNTIQVLWFEKKPRTPQYSSAQLTAWQL